MQIKNSSISHIPKVGTSEMEVAKVGPRCHEYYDVSKLNI